MEIEKDLKVVVSDFETTISEDKKTAVVTFPADSFNKFIGEELVKVQQNLMDKASTYVNNVTKLGYTQAGTLFAEHEEMSKVDIEAPIFRDGDRFQAHINRDEIDLVNTDEYVPVMKITQSVTSVENVRSGVRTMASTYNEIMSRKS